MVEKSTKITKNDELVRANAIHIFIIDIDYIWCYDGSASPVRKETVSWAFLFLFEDRCTAHGQGMCFAGFAAVRTSPFLASKGVAS
jgi:hypothetical protein